MSERKIVKRVSCDKAVSAARACFVSIFRQLSNFHAGLLLNTSIAVQC